MDVLRRGIEKRALVLENRELKRELETQSAPGPRILGNSESVKLLRRTVFYQKDQTGDILLQGERGTGKELAARLIHDQGNRQDEPFVAVKCRQLPEALLDIELFGSDQHGFATLPGYKNSKVAAAGKGTLFLDGIEALPAKSQARLSELLTTDERPRVIASTGLICPKRRARQVQSGALPIAVGAQAPFPSFARATRGCDHTVPELCPHHCVTLRGCPAKCRCRPQSHAAATFLARQCARATNLC